MRVVCEYKSGKVTSSELFGHETAHSICRSMFKEYYFLLSFMSGVCLVLLIFYGICFLFLMFSISNVDVIQSSDLC